MPIAELAGLRALKMKDGTWRVARQKPRPLRALDEPPILAGPFLTETVACRAIYAWVFGFKSASTTKA